MIDITLANKIGIMVILFFLIMDKLERMYSEVNIEGDKNN